MRNLILTFTYLILIDLINPATLPFNNKETRQVNFTNKIDGSNICFNNMTHNKNGRCVNKSISVCAQGWTTHRNTAQMLSDCVYIQRSKTAALLISVYFGVVGVDWFYLSRGNIRYIVIGIFKLLISCGCFGGWPLLMLGTYRLSESMIIIGHIISILFSLTSLTWWITDWARILTNKFPDGYGVELKQLPEYF